MVGELHYRQVGRVVLRHIGEDMLLVPVSGLAAQRNCVFPLNPTAAFIWERLSKGLSVTETAETLAVTFAVDRAQAIEDCEAYAQELVARQLLEVATP